MSEKKERIQLGDHFEYGRIIRFVFPSIVMMIFTSIYTIVDGLFVSNFAGTVPFAAINLIMPVFIIVGALGFMMGAGGAALVSQKLGEKRPEDANRYFSLFVNTVMVGGVIMSGLGQLALRQVAILLGADGTLLDNCILYGRIMLCSMVFFMLQNFFQSFMVVAEKPHLGLAFTVSAGVINIVLDALFVGLLGWGLTGAAFATLIAETFGGLAPMLYFLRPNGSLLRITRTRMMWSVLWKAVANGSSEMMNSISASVVTILYNKQLLRLAGADGVAAYGVIMYVAYIFLGVFMGYSVGIAPVFGYHYGAGHKAELRSLFCKTMGLLSCAGLMMTVVSWGLSGTLTDIFVGYDEDLRAMTLRGMRIYMTSFLVSWFVIFGSSFFTAVGSGLISATTSFLKTLVFECGAVLLLPLLLGLDGVWAAVLVADVMACVVTGAFLMKKRRAYFFD